MKKSTISITLATMLFSAGVMAQNAPAPQAPALPLAAPVSPNGAAVPATTSDGTPPNFVMQDNEPSLREAIRKQGIISMKKIDAELMKVEESLVPKDNGGLQKLLEQQMHERRKQEAEDLEKKTARSLSLLSVYGMEGQMMAEVQIGGPGGMRVTVTEGTRLPTGETVKKIGTASIEVGQPKAKHGETLWVSTTAAQAAYANYGKSSQGGNQPGGNQGNNMGGNGLPNGMTGGNLVPPTRIPNVWNPMDAIGQQK